MKVPKHLLMLLLHSFVSILSITNTVVAAVKDGTESASTLSMVSSRILQQQQQQQQIVAPTLVPSIIPTTTTVLPTPVLTVETITGPTPEPTISPTFQPITSQLDDDILSVPTTTTDDGNNSIDPDEPTDVPTTILIPAPTLASSSSLETNEPSSVPPSNVPTLYIVDTIVPAVVVMTKKPVITKIPVVVTKKPVMTKISKTKSPTCQPTKKLSKLYQPTTTKEVQQQPTIKKATASISPKPAVLPLSMKPTFKATSSISPRPKVSPVSKVPTFRAIASISPKPKISPSSNIPTPKGISTFIPSTNSTTNNSYSICYVCNNDNTQEVEKNDITNIYIMDSNVPCRNLYTVATTGLLPSAFCTTAIQLVSSKCSCIYIRSKPNQTAPTTTTKPPYINTQKPPTPAVTVSSSPTVSIPQQQPTSSGNNIFDRSNRPAKFTSQTPSILQSDTPSHIPSTIPSVVPTQFIIDAATTTTTTTPPTNITSSTNENNLNNRDVTSDSFIIFNGSQHSSQQYALTFVSSVASIVLLWW